MNSFQKEFITLIYAALSGEEQSISDSFDYSAGLDLAEKHSITALFCRGAELCHVAVPGQMIAKVSEDYCKAFIASEKQLRQLEVLFAAFEQNQIQYLPLKGTVLKPMYPSAELRSMGDADILIRLDQYPAIAEILTQLGYTFQKETGHELIWRKGVLLLELHKHIMTQENRDYYRYFGQGWERAVQRPESSRFVFSNEDFYTYVFAHLTKHYRISGIGIKHLLDIWVCRQSFSDLDMDYVEQELRKIAPTVGQYDVVVVGGGPAGFIAAITAARQGAKVALIERYGFLGGMATIGYVAPISVFAKNNELVIGGIPWEFVGRLKDMGGAFIEWPKIMISCELFKISVNRFFTSYFPLYSIICSLFFRIWRG